MADVEANSMQHPPFKTQNYLSAAQICLRFLSSVASLSAAWITFTSNESVMLYGMRFEARYTYSSTLWFFAFVNLSVSIFSVISLFIAGYDLARNGFDPKNYLYLFLHDLVMMTLVISASASAAAVGLIARNGNSHTGWLPICDHFPSFCHKSAISILLSIFSFIQYFVLTIISAYRFRIKIQA